jgi:NADPH2:quinone reductase
MNEQTYSAVVCERRGPPEGLSVKRLPRTPLAPGSIRIEVRAAGLNFPDVLMIRGAYQHKPAMPFVPGLEVAGVVTEVGTGVRGFLIGDAVMAQLSTGGYAEEAVAEASKVQSLPSRFSFAEGATFLVAHITAYHALRTRGSLTRGQTLLVMGAAGGVGLAAVQVGKALGARVIAAASSSGKLQAAAANGADDLIDYRKEPVETGVKRLTRDWGVDVLLDPVGVAQEVALRCLAWDGKLLVTGFAAGAIPSYAANRVLLKGASVIGVRAGEAGRHDPGLRSREMTELLALADARKVRPNVSAELPLERFAEAMALLSERRAIGRIALTTG